MFLNERRGDGDENELGDGRSPSFFMFSIEGSSNGWNGMLGFPAFGGLFFHQSRSSLSSIDSAVSPWNMAGLFDNISEVWSARLMHGRIRLYIYRCAHNVSKKGD